ncbi:hypothetical protein [Paenibacillus harenae]|uniref:Uncharacterized protein n=1 Tax=Paenibacillus harenae TaxID=306543 RepID=A0ABT9U7E0_PAEHA|nr:hypothetical protein [Paenibacillus harenae]MDQ0114359.1 hypothetical protein [Paenibacillus harenae]
MSDTEEKATTPKDRKASAKPKAAEQLIYVGPSLSGGLLAHNTVFRGGIPAQLQERMEQEPSIRDLIVPVTALAKTMNKIKQAGTAEQIAFSRLAAK